MSFTRSSRTAFLLSCQLTRPARLRAATTPRVPTAPQTRSVATFTPASQASAISVLQTNVDTSSEEFKENERQMAEAMARLKGLTRKSQLGGSVKAREKHLARKKMLPRDRVTALIDPGTTFLELSL